MIKSMNIAWWVERWSELHPYKPAVLFEGEEITYLQLHQRANRTGCWLQSLGIEKGDRVAVMLENCPEFIELYLACSRLGAIFVPVNFRLAPPELDYTLRNCRPRLFVFGSNFSETVFALNLNQRRPLMELACLGKQSCSSDVFDYHQGVVEFEGQRPFLTKSLGPADQWPYNLFCMIHGRDREAVLEKFHLIITSCGLEEIPKAVLFSRRRFKQRGAIYRPDTAIAARRQ